MIPNPQEAKSAFLERAAQTYAIASPVTAAHFMMVRASQDSVIESAKKTDRSGACEGCGAILIPGFTSETKIISPGSAAMPTTNADPSPGGKKVTHRWIMVKCTICCRYKKTMLGPLRGSRPIAKDREHATILVEGTSIALPTPARPLKVANRNQGSKQRAKSRRHGGLQALLEESKQSQRSINGLGLDLMDLMKQD